MGDRVTKRDRARSAEAALRLSLAALERCRELLINADADADDLAEYDAATEAVRCNIEEWTALAPAGRRALTEGAERG